MAATKLCRDCVFFLADCDARDPFRNSRCENPDSGLLNPVSGAQDLGYCTTERTLLGKCGPEGRLFVERAAFELAAPDHIGDTNGMVASQTVGA